MATDTVPKSAIVSSRRGTAETGMIVGSDPQGLSNREGALPMPYTKVTREQFKWDDRYLVHVPTGARFSWRYPGSRTGDATINWAHAGDRLANGADYDRGDVGRVAKELMIEKGGA